LEGGRKGPSGLKKNKNFTGGTMGLGGQSIEIQRIRSPIATLVGGGGGGSKAIMAEEFNLWGEST